MSDSAFTASMIFGNANRLIEAYHAVLQPICKETGLPPMAVDILMFFSNNPENGTAKELCLCRGLKAGIVSVHIDRLVNEGLLLRQSYPGDRRKTQLVCTEKASAIIEQGRELQKCFARELLIGLSEEDIKVFHKCLTVLGENAEEIRKNGILAEDRG